MKLASRKVLPPPPIQFCDGRVGRQRCRNDGFVTCGSLDVLAGPVRKIQLSPL
jgi:hypothetical protein